jgi:hypothetical protein
MKVHDTWFSPCLDPDASILRWVGSILHRYLHLCYFAWVCFAKDLALAVWAVATHVLVIAINTAFLLASPVGVWIHAYYWRKQARSDAVFSRWVESTIKRGPNA